MNAEIVKIDTQDNLIKRFHNCRNKPNVDLETFEPVEVFGFFRSGAKTAWLKSKVNVKSVELNKFPYPYTVKKISKKHFEIRSNFFQKYFDKGDVIELLIKKYSDAE